MANPTPGTIEYAYNRIYVVVDPSAPAGPPVYRVSNPDDFPAAGGGTGKTYDFEGEAPINVTDTPGVGTNPNRVVTSIDIQQLDDRAV